MIIYKLVCWFFIPVLAHAECHRNWEHFENSCYLFSDHQLNWYEAQSSCQAHNSKLAEVETASEATFLRDKAKRYGGVFIKAECQRNWEHFGVSCYWFSNKSLNWHDAQTSCHSYNAKLAEIETLQEATFLREKARIYGGDWWLGGYDEVEEGKWVWASNGLPFSVSDWGKGEPDNIENQDCLDIFQLADFHWDDFECTRAQNFICESSFTDAEIEG